MEPTPILFVGLAVVLSIASTVLAVYYFFKLIKAFDIQTSMGYLLMFIYLLLICVYFIDKVVGVRADLLSETESKYIFEMIQGFSLTILGYIFGTKTKQS